MSLPPRGAPDASEFVLDQMGLELALDRVLKSARELTGARYGALCVLNDARDGLALFLTTGIDDDTRARIGKWPCGRGMLGDLILDPVPLRVANLGEHPHCYGTPAGHPPMPSFLGVPIVVDHVPDGSFYLTEKTAGNRSPIRTRNRSTRSPVSRAWRSSAVGGELRRSDRRVSDRQGCRFRGRAAAAGWRDVDDPVTASAS